MEKEQKIDIREFEVFKVRLSKPEERGGYKIFVDNPNGEEFHIFGLGSHNSTPEQLEKCKAFCEYWALHLNQAYMAGFLNKDGCFLKHTEETFQRLDDLYKKAF